MDLQSEGLAMQLCLALSASEPRACHLTSLMPHFIRCEMEIIITVSEQIQCDHVDGKLISKLNSLYPQK